ncbi:hypothetical protein BJ944DRAFT_239352 [Cunninghamella echinulata]|nr:hypothetical protein BJ944DRAFT_239352 [Cunninghamella echinulata]
MRKQLEGAIDNVQDGVDKATELLDEKVGEGATKPSCPTEKGLQDPSLFRQPGFKIGDIWEHPDKPRIQQHKLRILMYPPMYSLLSWFSYLRPDYATTILFFATIFEAFAVYNLYTCLQDYLLPLRMKAGDKKESIKIKLRCIRFRMSIIKSLISIISQSQGYYCESSFNFRGTHIYLVLINIVSLVTAIITLIIYLVVYREDFKQLQVPSRGMFWTIKLPIFIEFFIRNILSSILKYVAIIKAKKTGNHGLDQGRAEQIKVGLESIITCFIMCVASLMMIKYYNLDKDISRTQHYNETSYSYIEDEDEIQMEQNSNDIILSDNINDINTDAIQLKKLPVWFAIMDAYFYYIPEFIRQVYGCWAGTCQLVCKRRQLIKNRRKNIDTVNKVNEAATGTDCNFSLENNNNITNTHSINNIYPPTLEPNINTTTTQP